MKALHAPVADPSSIAYQFAKVAMAHADFPAVMSEAGAISYAQLLVTSIAFAKRLRRIGVDRTSTVAMNTGDAPSALAMMFATSFLGCRLVTAGKVLQNQSIIEPTHFFRTPDSLGKRGLGFTKIDESWAEDTKDVCLSDIDSFPGHADPEDIWLVLHTSGTTGKPKFIGLSQRVVSDRTAAIADDFPKAGVTAAMIFGCTSRPYYARALGALLNACTLVDSTDQAFWKRAGVNVVFCSPSQFLSFIEKHGFEHRFKKVEVSGAKLEDELARTLVKHFDNVIDIYGASETNKTFANYVSARPDGTILRRGRKLDSQIEILTEDGLPCAPGEKGTVRVRNGYMAQGYVGAPEATARNFRDGWFYPGDVGLFGEHGQLEIVGRNDEVISFGGVKIDARLIDLIIKSVAGVKDAISFKSPKATRNEVLAFVVFEDGVDRNDCIHKVREAYQTHTGLPCFLGRIHAIDELPYTDSGRPMRQLCQEMVLDKAKAGEAY